MTDDMKPRGGTGTFDGLNFAAANFETKGSTATANSMAAAAAASIKEEEESKERRADHRSKPQHHPTGHKHLAPAHTHTTRRPLTPNHTHPAQLRIDLFPSIVTGGGTAGAEGVSVSHVSKNGVSFFPHFSFNDEGKEGGEEEGEEVSGRMEGEGETSRVSSTEMDDDISIRYTTPTMASNHIVRPLPSPSSLSVPQPSIGSGIGSSVEHSVVGSVGMPYKGRMGTAREGSAFFPSVFSPKSSVNSLQSTDMYGEEGVTSSPLSRSSIACCYSRIAAFSFITVVSHTQSTARLPSSSRLRSSTPTPSVASVHVSLCRLLRLLVLALPSDHNYPVTATTSWRSSDPQHPRHPAGFSIIRRQRADQPHVHKRVPATQATAVASPLYAACWFHARWAASSQYERHNITTNRRLSTHLVASVPRPSRTLTGWYVPQLVAASILRLSRTRHTSLLLVNLVCFHNTSTPRPSRRSVL